jgi:hypothetical protein
MIPDNVHCPRPTQTHRIVGRGIVTHHVDSNDALALLHRNTQAGTQYAFVSTQATVERATLHASADDKTSPHSEKYGYS